MLILLQWINIIIDCRISIPGHRRDVVYDGLNATYKRLILHLMANFQLPGNERFDTQMKLHTATKNTDMSSALEFQKYLSNESRKPGILDNRKHKKGQGKNGQIESIM